MPIFKLMVILVQAFTDNVNQRNHKRREFFYIRYCGIYWLPWYHWGFFGNNLNNSICIILVSNSRYRKSGGEHGTRCRMPLRQIATKCFIWRINEQSDSISSPQFLLCFCAYKRDIRIFEHLISLYMFKHIVSFVLLYLLTCWLNITSV